MNLYCYECKGNCTGISKSIDDKIDDLIFNIIDKIKLIFLYCLCKKN